MHKLTVSKSGETINSWIFSVTVKDDSGESNHKVEVDKTYFKELTNEKITAVMLVSNSMSFLLDREPKEAILTEFNLREINNYFKDYESFIKENL